MFGWVLTRGKKPETAPEVVPPRVQERLTRLEIELEDVRTLVEATWARQRKVEGTVHGMRGASRRWPTGGQEEETLDEYRNRMVREGRLSASKAVNTNGDT